MKLTTEQIESNKKEFIRLLKSTLRPGINELCEWLEKQSDFFTAPSSSRFHGSYKGGLCQHSLNVYYAATKLKANMSDLALPEKNLDGIEENSVIVAALLHDLCKANFYRENVKVYKDDASGAWKHYIGYDIVDQLPLGHGEKSAIIAQQFIRMSAAELCAIRWHMGCGDPGAFVSPYEKPALNTAMDNVPLLILIQNADMFASYLMEGENNQKVDNAID